MEGGTFMARPVRAWVSIFPLDGTGKYSLGGTKPPFLQKVRADPHLEHSGASLRMGGHRREVLSIVAPQLLSSRRFPPSPRSSQPWQA